MSEPCPLCGREKLKDRVHRLPPTAIDEHQSLCLQPAHIYDQPWPPCEALGVKRLADAEAEVCRLRALINRDRTGLAEAIDRMVKEASGRLWVTDGRGPYAWDDERYKDEAGQALRAVIAIGKKALSDSGALADSAHHPEAPKIVMWGGKPMKEGRCPPGDTCLACDRLGKHLEPVEETPR